MLDMIPAISLGSFIHLEPEGGLLQYENKRAKNPLEKWLLKQTDDFTIEVLRMCNGTLSVRDIVKRLRRKYPKRNSEEILSILEWAEWLGVVHLFPTADVVPIAFRGHITLSGSRKFYAPLHMHVEVTTACNFWCKHCYREAGPGVKGFAINVPKLKRALTALKAKGLNVIELTGGEPLLHPEIHQIINFCTSNFDVTTLLTNGFYVTKDFVETLGPYPTPVTLITAVSFYGTNPRTHDKFTGVNKSFKRAVRACNYLLKKGIPVRMNYSVTPQNIGGIKDVPKLAKRLGIRAIACSPVIPLGRGSRIGWGKVSRKKVLVYLKDFHRMVKIHPNFFQFISEEFLDLFVGTGHCGAGYRSFCLSPEGVVRPCIFISPGLMDLGNLFNERIERVLNHPLAKVLSKINSPNVGDCSGCRYKNFCLGCWYRGLLASKYVANCRWEKGKLICSRINTDKLGMIAKECNLQDLSGRLTGYG